MKRLVLIVSLLIMGLNSVNAASWRVCSRIGSGAQFASIAEANNSSEVQNGDTLYLDPGHHERASVNLSKSLIILGSGYFLSNNNLSLMSFEESTLSGISLIEGSQIIGCSVLGSLYFSSNTIVNRCKLVHPSRGYALYTNDNQGTINNVIINGCYIDGDIALTRPITFAQINNNIIHCEYIYSSSSISNSGFYNNTWYGCQLLGFSYSDIFNNIIIRTSYTSSAIFSSTTCSVHNNIISGDSVMYSSTSFLSNNQFGATVENSLKCTGPIEEYYEHKPDGLAVGAGVNGTTCGAYGSYNGSIPYNKSGIPMGSPYIYDATFDAHPSTTNTINAQFKIKVKNE